MSCAACSAHVERAVAAVPGVRSVAVSLLTNSMQVDYAPGADPDAVNTAILDAVAAAGYGAAAAGADLDEAALEDTETPRLKRRLITSLCFWSRCCISRWAYGVGLPLPPFMDGGGWEALVFALAQLALTLPVCYINRAFFISGWKGLRSLSPAWITLVALGAGAALLYGLLCRCDDCRRPPCGNEAQVLQFRHDLYFESAAMILTPDHGRGKMLEALLQRQDDDGAQKPDGAGPAHQPACCATAARLRCRLAKCRSAMCSLCVRARASRWTAW